MKNLQLMVDIDQNSGTMDNIKNTCGDTMDVIVHQKTVALKELTPLGIMLKDLQMSLLGAVVNQMKRGELEELKEISIAKSKSYLAGIGFNIELYEMYIDFKSQAYALNFGASNSTAIIKGKMAVKEIDWVKLALDEKKIKNFLKSGHIYVNQYHTKVSVAKAGNTLAEQMRNDCLCKPYVVFRATDPVDAVSIVFMQIGKNI